MIVDMECGIIAVGKEEPIKIKIKDIRVDIGEIKMTDTWHTFQTKITHHEYDEMEVDIDHDRNSIIPKISVKVQDGSNSRVTLTLDELRELVRLGERFQDAHATMKGSNDDQ